MGRCKQSPELLEDDFSAAQTFAEDAVQLTNSEKTALCQLGLGCAQTQADGKKKLTLFSPIFLPYRSSPLSTNLPK